MSKTKRIIALLMALVVVFSLAACTQKGPKPNKGTKPSETTPQETTPPETTEPTPEITVENPVTFFSMTFGENYSDIKFMTAFPNEDGSVYVDYVGADKKSGNMEAWILHGIADALAKTELAALNGASDYVDGEANGSMYIEFADGTMWTADYAGVVPEDYITGYEAMSAYFDQLTADMPVYVPQPQVMEPIDTVLRDEMLAIFNNSGMENLDGIAIMGIDPTDEFFASSAGLSSADSVTAGASGAPMMMSVAYSMVIVTLDDASKADDICADFENNIDWRKWVCVAPTDAMIATKDNMVLCVLGADDMFAKTVDGIEATGWAEIKTLHNPDL